MQMAWVIFKYVITEVMNFSPNIKSMLIRESSFFTIFHFVIVSVLVEWLSTNGRRERLQKCIKFSIHAKIRWVIETAIFLFIKENLC